MTHPSLIDLWSSQPIMEFRPAATRILIAEDNFDLRTIFAKIFASKHFEVQIAVDGWEALATLERMQPDILLLDVNMPNVSGLEVLNYIRQNPELKHIKVIVVTGNSQAAQSPELQLADLFLLKPVSLPELVILVQRLSA